MERYPLLKINLAALENNGKCMVSLCAKYGISVSAVVKGVNSIVECCSVLNKCGFAGLASSRMEQIKLLKKQFPSTSMMLVRIPMFSELKDLVRYADSSLISETETLLQIDAEANSQSVKHKVILMYDLGDLREGYFVREELLEAALMVEYKLKNVELYGVGTNLSCYGSIKPTIKNMTELASIATEIQAKIGRKLEVVSGGATTVIPPLMLGGIPKEINHLRLGECLYTYPMSWDDDVEGMNRNAFRIKTQVLEINSKPTFPIGEIGVAAFGKKREYEDRGIRKRAILALGNQDLGDSKNTLIPIDKEMFVLGASGDHTIVDIEDCKYKYKLGDIMEFNLTYQGVVFSTMSPWVRKKFE
jgi:predicted amino acid racemase